MKASQKEVVVGNWKCKTLCSPDNLGAGRQKAGEHQTFNLPRNKFSDIFPMQFLCGKSQGPYEINWCCKAIESRRLKVWQGLGLAWLIRRPSSLPTKVCPPRAKHQTDRGRSCSKEKKAQNPIVQAGTVMGVIFLALFQGRKGQFWIKWVSSQHHLHWRAHF